MARIIHRGNLMDIYNNRNNMSNLQILDAAKHLRADIDIGNVVWDSYSRSSQTITMSDAFATLELTLYHGPNGDYWDLNLKTIVHI